MSDTEKRGRGRPPSWHTRITAPPLAKDLYALLAKIQKSDAFTKCHVYHGADLHGTPMVKWQGRTTGLAFMIASYMGLPNATKTCATPGCCNPFHYLPPDYSGEVLIHGKERSGDVLSTDLEDWADLVEYELDKAMLRLNEATFEEIRAVIPAEDLSDEQLVDTLKYMKEGKDE